MDDRLGQLTQFDSSAPSGGAQIEEFLVREPDGDYCVAQRLAGLVVPAGRTLVVSYPNEFQLAPNDQRGLGDNRCSTALEGTYGINVTTHVGFGRTLLPESFKEQFVVSAPPR